MSAFKSVRVFNARYPWAGPLLWIANVQYFVVMLLVSTYWPFPYNNRVNTISDLGNTVCGTYRRRDVCSPMHVYMNISFVILGLTMLLGSMLIYNEFKKTAASRIGFTLMALAGLDTVLVGLFPENTAFKLHFSSALLLFLIGDVAILLLGLGLPVHRWLRDYSIVTAALTLSALAFYVSKHYLGFGKGGMERLVSYPQTLWLVVFGLYMSHKRIRKVVKKL